MHNIETDQYVQALEQELEETNRGLVALTVELEQSQEKYRNIFEHSIEAIFQVNANGFITLANPACMQLLGYDCLAILQSEIPHIRALYQDPSDHDTLMTRLKNDKVIRGWVAPVQRRDGKIMLVVENVRRIDNKHGQIHGYESMAADITLQRQIEKRLELVAKVFEFLTDGIVITDANTKILEVNQAFSAITLYSSAEVVGKTTSILYSGWHNQDFYSDMWNAINTTGFWRGEVTDRRKDGETYVQQLTICAIKNEAGDLINYIGIFDDITKKKESENKIHQLAYYDVLTKLPNRSLFNDRLRHAIRVAGRNKQLLALLFIDLDNFKSINDTLGHFVGDKFLIQVAAVMQGCIREKDTVARLGGDEFVIILEELHSSHDASQVAKQILLKLAQTFLIGGHDIISGASIGISIYPTDSDDCQALIKYADTAMYSAKEQGKNDFRFFTDEMNIRAFERVRMEKDLRRALKQREFVLYYQPKVDISGKIVTGCEVLIRWQHPEMGFLPPYKFISMAEETGLIEPIGQLVLEMAFQQYRCWLDAGHKLPPVAINLSPKQLKIELLQQVISLLSASGLSGTLVELEITESAIMAEPQVAIQILKGLRDIGLQLSIDDFGTGYSSLSYLKRLPVNTVKIDQSFVKDIDSDADGHAIVEAIIALCKKMGLKVVAEGVEKKSQMAFLQENGCDEIQGYFIAKPLSATDFIDFLNRSHA